MKKGTSFLAATLLAGGFLAVPVAGLACGPSHGQETDVYYAPAVYRGGLGTLLGGVFGGILGAHVGAGHGRAAGIIGGTLLGAVIGHEIGESLDRTDDLYAQRALEGNRTGEEVIWVNPDTNAQVAVTPTRTHRSAGQEYCREYMTEVKVGGEDRTAYGTACRQSDGSWQIVN